MVIADRAEEFKSRFQIIANFTNGCQIPASVAVIWCTPHGDYVLVVEMIFVSLVDQLVGACNEREIIYVAEFVGDSVTK